MGTFTAPVRGSGGCAAWISFVSNRMVPRVGEEAEEGTPGPDPGRAGPLRPPHEHGARLLEPHDELAEGGVGGDFGERRPENGGDGPFEDGLVGERPLEDLLLRDTFDALLPGKHRELGDVVAAEELERVLYERRRLDAHERRYPFFHEEEVGGSTGVIEESLLAHPLVGA